MQHPLAPHPRIDSEIRQMCALFEAHGSHRFGYTLIPPFRSIADDQVLLVSRGFDPEWSFLYSKPAFRSADPVGHFMLGASRPCSWLNAAQAKALTLDQQQFMLKYRQMKIGDGISLPLFGRNDMFGIAVFSTHEEMELDDPKIGFLHTQAQLAHQRISGILLESMQTQCQLSPREEHVLKHIVSGDCNRKISAELGIALSTVDTYVRRLFIKLDASDRVTAATRALSLGLVRL